MNCTCNLFFCELDLLDLKPFSLSSPFSITRFNFVCLHLLLTRASLLALAESIYYWSLLSNNSVIFRAQVELTDSTNRPIRLTQCCTQFKSPGDKILCVLYLHYNLAFTFKWYGNSWNKAFYSQRVWIGYNIELAE